MNNVLNLNDEGLKKFVLLQYAPGMSKYIQVHVSYETLARIYQRISVQWSKLGETDPHFSVLSAPKFRASSILDSIDAFTETGKYALENFLSLCEKNTIYAKSDARVLELGCGVGRSTIFFAKRFHSVEGWDVSSGNLKVCDATLRAQGITNVTLKLITKLEDYKDAKPFDVLISEIALQHNPPLYSISFSITFCPNLKMAEYSIFKL